MHAGLGGLHRIVLIVNRRSGTGEIEDLVDLDVERERHVVTHQLEPLVVEQREDVFARAREEIVDAQHVVAVGQQALAEMRAQEAGAAGDEYSLAVDQNQPLNRRVCCNLPAHRPKHALSRHAPSQGRPGSVICLAVVEPNLAQAEKGDAPPPARRSSGRPA